jgi:DNA sulfur modification protein DndC
MKIQPANRFILDKVAQFGEVVMILGARKSESSSRGQIINTRQQGLMEGRTDKRDEEAKSTFDYTKVNVRYGRLSRHSSLTRAWVFTPIEDFTTDDVWEYLLQVDSPWGNDNQQLAALYRSAQAGECPLVIDESTPSCGNSRFGCWVCTVVTKDKSMTSLIDNGEEWMLPLLQFRDRLADTQKPERKGDVRDFKRRDGRVKYKKDGTVIWGPYTMDFRRRLLRDLLETQRLVNNSSKGFGMELISVTELHEIRRIWITEERDWEDTLPVIVREVLGRELQWVNDDIGLFKPRDKELLEALCREKDIPVELVTKLLEVERQMQGMSRRASVQNKIKAVLSEDWRTRDQVLNREDTLLGTFSESRR